MKPYFASILLIVLGATAAWGHDLSPEQRINKLHVRVLEVERSVRTPFWIAVAAYATAAAASGAICMLYAQLNQKRLSLWCWAGVVVPIAALLVMVVFIAKSKSEEQEYSA